jgi:hypothetical protein
MGLGRCADSVVLCHNELGLSWLPGKVDHDGPKPITAFPEEAALASRDVAGPAACYLSACDNVLGFSANMGSNNSFGLGQHRVRLAVLGARADGDCAGVEKAPLASGDDSVQGARADS